MKKGIIFILCLAGLWLGAATIQWFSDQPATTSPADSDIIALERPSPHGYKSATLAVLKAYIGTNGTLVISNFYAERGTNVYLTVQNAYFTNVYAPYITNLFFYTTNIYATYSTNQYAYITNLYATTINASTITNDFAVFTNVVIYGLTDVDTLYVGNAFINTNNVGTQWLTNGQWRAISTWLGPSNTYYLNTNRYSYVTYTPCDLTNFSGTVSGWSADSGITFSNAASTNVTITISALNYWSGDYTNQYTMTNGEVMDLAMESDGTVYTKGLARKFAKQQ